MQIAELKNLAMSFDTAEKRPVFVGADVNVTDGSNAVLDKDHFAVWNVDKKKVASVVSDQYNLIQHKTVVDEVVEAVSNLAIPAEVTKVNNCGNKVFIDINFTQAKLYVKQGEEFYTGIRIVNSYDKTTGIMVLPHLVRLACSNGMVANVGWVKEFCVAHSDKLAKDFASIIPKMIMSMADNSDKFTAMVNNCIGDSIEWALLDKIMNDLLANRKKHYEAIKFRVKENCGDRLPTRWDVYNAFTSYATHGQQIKPTIENWLQNRAQKVLVTPLVDLVPKEVTIE